MEHRATGINPETKTVKTIIKSGMTHMLKYGRLIIRTGVVPVRPSLILIFMHNFIYCLKIWKVLV